MTEVCPEYRDLFRSGFDDIERCAIAGFQERHQDLSSFLINRSSLRIDEIVQFIRRVNFHEQNEYIAVDKEPGTMNLEANFGKEK